MTPNMYAPQEARSQRTQREINQLSRIALPYKQEDGPFTTPSDLAWACAIRESRVIRWIGNRSSTSGWHVFRCRRLGTANNDLVLIIDGFMRHVMPHNAQHTEKSMEDIFMSAAKRTASWSVGGKPTSMALAARRAILYWRKHRPYEQRPLAASNLADITIGELTA